MSQVFTQDITPLSNVVENILHEEKEHPRLVPVRVIGEFSPITVFAQLTSSVVDACHRVGLGDPFRLYFSPQLSMLSVSAYWDSGSVSMETSNYSVGKLEGDDLIQFMAQIKAQIKAQKD